MKGGGKEKRKQRKGKANDSVLFSARSFSFTRLYGRLFLAAGAFNLIARSAGNFRGGRPDLSVLRRSAAKRARYCHCLKLPLLSHYDAK